MYQKKIHQLFILINIKDSIEPLKYCEYKNILHFKYKITSVFLVRYKLT
jgi:hypothetical protein